MHKEKGIVKYTENGKFWYFIHPIDIKEVDRQNKKYIQSLMWGSKK